MTDLPMNQWVDDDTLDADGAYVGLRTTNDDQTPDGVAICLILDRDGVTMKFSYTFDPAEAVRFAEVMTESALLVRLAQQ